MNVLAHTHADYIFDGEKSQNFWMELIVVRKE